MVLIVSSSQRIDKAVRIGDDVGALKLCSIRRERALEQLGHFDRHRVLIPSNSTPTLCKNALSILRKTCLDRSGAVLCDFEVYWRRWIRQLVDSNKRQHTTSR